MKSIIYFMQSTIPDLAAIAFVIGFFSFGYSSDVSNGFSTNADHECRFWGMLAIGTFDTTNTRGHLEYLQNLAIGNPDGWGIGFYTPTTRGYRIPVIYKGAWRADQDCRYDTAANFMLRNFVNSGVAHIRNKGLSLVVNCPDPHPFYTFGVYRDFNMLFAHNGSVDIATLKTLIGNYKNVNHWDYWGTSTDDPIHDTDLYRLFLMSRIDQNPSVGITDCLVNALNEYVAAYGPSSVMNFVLASKYDTLWALRYNESLYYRLEIRIDENVWEVASQTLGGLGWIQADNYTLYVFKPDRTTPIKRSINHAVESPGFGGNTQSNDSSTPSFFTCHYDQRHNSLKIEFSDTDFNEISLRIFNILGQTVSKIGNVLIKTGTKTSNYDIGSLPSGIYFVRVEADGLKATRKIVIRH
jgi:predicted glutamine amidotransferase